MKPVYKPLQLSRLQLQHLLSRVQYYRPRASLSRASSVSFFCRTYICAVCFFYFFAFFRCVCKPPACPAPVCNCPKLLYKAPICKAPVCPQPVCPEPVCPEPVCPEPRASCPPCPQPMCPKPICPPPNPLSCPQVVRPSCPRQVCHLIEREQNLTCPPPVMSCPTPEVILPPIPELNCPVPVVVNNCTQERPAVAENKLPLPPRLKKSSR